MNDELSPEEHDALAEALREHLLGLRATILECGDPEEKLRLKSKEEMLKSILGKVEPGANM